MLFEDESIIAVEKSAEMALSVPPGRERIPGTRTLQDQVLEYVRGTGGRKAGAWGVHDLDREASGIVVFAKSPAAAESLRSAFAAKKCDAIYLAVVEGEMGRQGPGGTATDRAESLSDGRSEGMRAGTGDSLDSVSGGEVGGDSFAPASGSEESGGPVGAELLGGSTPERASKASRAITGTVRSFIKKAGSRVESIPPDEFSGDRSGGKRPEAPRLAITHYRVVASGRGHTLARLRVKSPRMHQARVHMRDLGHPVLGDGLYGSHDTRGRVMLHLAELSFPHPGTHAPMRLTSAAPAALWQAIGSRTPAESGGSAERVAGTTAANADQGWEHVAEWYDALVSDKRSDLQDELVTPGVLRLLEARRGERVVDVACGPGELCRRMASMGVSAVGVDASARMIDAARERAGRDVVSQADATPTFTVCDARRLGELPAMLADGPNVGPSSRAGGATEHERGFDAATCVLALMNIEPIGDVLAGVSSLLKPGGRFVAVILHPAFRSPGLSSWGWAEETTSPTGRGGVVQRQYRRIDAYLGEQARQVTMNPGAAARGESPVVTTTHHRPIGAYLTAFGQAGLLVDRVEEWASPRRSQPGPRAIEEDRARREFPMFMAIRAVKR